MSAPQDIDTVQHLCRARAGEGLGQSEYLLVLCIKSSEEASRSAM